MEFKIIIRDECVSLAIFDPTNDEYRGERVVFRGAPFRFRWAEDFAEFTGFDVIKEKGR